MPLENSIKNTNKRTSIAPWTGWELCIWYPLNDYIPYIKTASKEAKEELFSIMQSNLMGNFLVSCNPLWDTHLITNDPMEDTHRITNDLLTKNSDYWKNDW